MNMVMCWLTGLDSMAQLFESLLKKGDRWVFLMFINILIL